MKEMYLDYCRSNQNLRTCSCTKRSRLKLISFMIIILFLSQYAAYAGEVNSNLLVPNLKNVNSVGALRQKGTSYLPKPLASEEEFEEELEECNEEVYNREFPCANGFIRHELIKTCIEKVGVDIEGDRRTWVKASEYCHQLQGDLILIEDIVYNVYVEGELDETQLYWINARRKLDIYVTSKGIQVPFLYLKFAKSAGLDEDNCLAMSGGNEGKWFAKPCNTKLPFVCAMPDLNFPGKPTLTFNSHKSHKQKRYVFGGDDINATCTIPDLRGATSFFRMLEYEDKFKEFNSFKRDPDFKVTKVEMYQRGPDLRCHKYAHMVLSHKITKAINNKQIDCVAVGADEVNRTSGINIIQVVYKWTLPKMSVNAFQDSRNTVYPGQPFYVKCKGFVGELDENETEGILSVVVDKGSSTKADENLVVMSYYRGKLIGNGDYDTSFNYTKHHTGTDKAQGTWVEYGVSINRIKPEHHQWKIICLTAPYKKNIRKLLRDKDTRKATAGPLNVQYEPGKPVLKVNYHEKPSTVYDAHKLRAECSAIMGSSPVLTWTLKEFVWNYDAATDKVEGPRIGVQFNHTTYKINEQQGYSVTSSIELVVNKGMEKSKLSCYSSHDVTPGDQPQYGVSSLPLKLKFVPGEPKLSKTQENLGRLEANCTASVGEGGTLSWVLTDGGATRTWWINLKGEVRKADQLAFDSDINVLEPQVLREKERQNPVIVSLIQIKLPPRKPDTFLYCLSYKFDVNKDVTSNNTEDLFKPGLFQSVRVGKERNLTMQASTGGSREQSLLEMMTNWLRIAFLAFAILIVVIPGIIMANTVFRREKTEDVKETQAPPTEEAPKKDVSFAGDDEVIEPSEAGSGVSNYNPTTSATVSESSSE